MTRPSREAYGRCPWCRTFTVYSDRFQENTVYCSVCHTRFPKPGTAHARQIADMEVKG